MDDEIKWLRQAIVTRRKPPAVARPVKQALSELLTKGQFAARQQQQAVRNAWKVAAGLELAQHSVPGKIRRGVLEVIVADSMVSQEITMRQRQIIQALKKTLPDFPIRSFRCRLGKLDSD